MINHPTVLIADDDEAIRNVIVSVVKGVLPSARITSVENGEEALNCYRKDGVDLVISNFMMPKMNGPTFVSLLRDSKESVPIIMVSGSSEAEKLGLEAGIDCFVDKFDLLKRLPRVIRCLLDTEGGSRVHYPSAA